MLDALKGISTALGLLAATAAVAQAQTPAFTKNQATANIVAQALRSSANLAPYRIEIETSGCLTTLTGTVATAAEKKEAISLASQCPGVGGVVDRLQVAPENAVRPVQYQVAMRPSRLAGGPSGDIIYDGNAMPGPGGYTGNVVNGAPGYGAPGYGAPGYGAPVNGAPGNSAPGYSAPSYGAPSYGAPGMAGPGMNGAAGMVDPNAPPMDGPMPEGPSGTTGASMTAMPRNPNYAWPSYAPYPNFSAVGYPTVYPWQAWPNIAPPYPYPEVPLDWRAVTLRWDDGIWWLDFKKNYTRPFFTPYPFGIFAY
jgi:hypothetical protein